jgi:T-complex protein 1 subunit eta
MIVEQNGKATITNDGATVLQLLDIVHPAARCLVDTANAQDNEAGDGTTSVTLLGAEFLRQARPYIDEGVHPRTIIRAYRAACDLAIQHLEELSSPLGTEDLRDRLMKLASTSMNSKLIASEKLSFSEMVVDAVNMSGADLDIDAIGIKEELGGSLQDSFLVPGIAFKKTFSYAGHEQLPKHFDTPMIALLNITLEWQAERENAEIRIEDPSRYQEIVDAEYQIIYDKLEKLVAAGANVVLSKLPIGDLATQFFADHGIFCAGRVEDADLKRMSKATGAMIQTTVSDLTAADLGTCATFEERQVGAERYNVFSGCPKADACTIVLRGGADQFIQESKRSLHDAIMVVRRSLRSSAVVAGGGAIEMALSKYLTDEARGIRGKQQLLIAAFAKALEVIPHQLSTNAGFNATDVVNALRAKHARTDGVCWFGVDIVSGGITDTMEAHVWEPALLKFNAIRAATEAACIVLSVDQTVRNPQSKELEESRQKTAAMRNKLQGQGMAPGGAQAGGLGRGMRAMQGKGGK